MDTHPPDSISSLFQDPVRRTRPTRWLEWCLLAALLLSAVAALSALRGLERLDLVFNDQLGRLSSPQVSPDVVIVAIDDKSLEAIGRWPWRRAIHAAVLDRIAAAKPRAVGLDLIVVDRDPVESGDDALLGEAMARWVMVWLVDQ